jgi:hypothetical protein
MANLFQEVIPAILQNKKDVIQTDQDERDYKPFLVNRTLSYHSDCFFYANMMNMYPLLDKKLQFQYLLNSIRPMKRKYEQWQKVEDDERLVSIKEYFGLSNEKAKEALRILTTEQISHIQEKTNTGGVKK